MPWLNAAMTTTSRRADAFGLVMLVAGSVVLPVVGYGIGVWRLWASTRWTRVDKVLGTALGPLALAGPALLYVASRTNEPDGSNSAVAMLVGIASLCVAIAIRLIYKLARTP
jgi:hypothetical protein